MDSLTQLALGAAVGDATLGHRIGRRAIVWGAALGTLPDLDILIPAVDDVAAFTEHRSWSHSVFVLTALTPVLALVVARCHAELGVGWRRAAAMVWLVFVTHVLLDCCTAYGTQILWPIPTPPVAWASVFIIDPLYTLPLLAGLAGSLRRRRTAPRRATRWNATGLALSTAYLVWTLVAQQIVTARTTTELAKAGVVARTVFVTPTPFNSLLWRVVAVTDGGYVEGLHSLVADGDEVTFDAPTPGPAVDRAELRGMPAFDRLEWFTRGAYSLRRDGELLVFTDLRMGGAGAYPFEFTIAARAGGGWREVEPYKLPSDFGPDRLALVWRRLWHPTR